MKTRNEIYQGEGAQLLRFITTYHSLQYEQVLRLFSKNRESIKSLITSLVKQKRIIYDKENGLLCDSQESANNPDYGMIASFWVLLDFKTAIMYHTDGEFPVKLNFFSKDEWYEVLYVPQEQEYLINHVMESQTTAGSIRNGRTGCKNSYHRRDCLLPCRLLYRICQLLCKEMRYV